MEQIEQETLADRRKKLETDQIDYEMMRDECKSMLNKLGEQEDDLQMRLMPIQESIAELHEKQDFIKSRLDEISDELDLIAEATEN